ncbi:MAG: acetyl-CoA carboxylase biotin carboxyl carrier protein [Gammaproteobacteria bacterium]|nr:acetyl-CoA carboxylase biotin carboxyl carrier protein [Gammaproteobacteria bacterium]MBT4493163.1 acetyl-CoA carboxylase biotin carboxyl carrier protein [Gammaproteobacteria bacterium]
MDIRKVKKLIEMMEESDISEIEVKEGDDSVRISRGGVVIPSRSTPVVDRGELKPAATPVIKGHVITAPMVGTFYRAPSPSSPSFVEIGDQIKEGDTLCIIESMKMMNHIKADQAGQVEAILVVNEDAVEFDQPLFTLI